MAIAQDKDAAGAAARCPVDHSKFGSKIGLRPESEGSIPLEVDTNGVWQVRGFEETRAVLRSNTTRQAGFGAEMMGGATLDKMPILYQEGKPHNEQRAKTARFFTPKTVSNNYRRMMERLADRIVGHIRQKGRIDLSKMSLVMAVQVTSQVVGLTNSSLNGRAKRLDAFFDQVSLSKKETLLGKLRQIINSRRLLTFYWFDVRPAIKARKQKPQEDVISHLIEQGYKDAEILTECITYGAAGMATTREFIVMAAWHMLSHPELKNRYLAAPEPERLDILHEILRLEPVVGHLYRRATADITVKSGGQEHTIPSGAKIDLNIEVTNTDGRVVGHEPEAVCPGRELNADRAGAMLMSFGDGAHRCPGAYLAIQETDIFLTRLLKINGLRIENPPTLVWDELTAGYILREFMVVVDAK